MSALIGIPRETTSRPPETALDLYKRHGQRVYSFCMSRLRNPEEAQDAAQTTFVYVVGALKRGVVPRNEVAWLLTIADNVCRSTRRSLGRRLARVADAEVDELEAAAGTMTVETSQQVGDLRAALEHLPESQRRAILLREWQGLSYADIADQLDLSVGAVETLLFRARKGMSAQLQRSRSRLRVLDLASALSLARSVLGGGAGKVAVGAAGLAIVAASHAVERQIAAADSEAPLLSVSAPAAKARAAVRSSAGVQIRKPLRARNAHRTPRRVAGPASRSSSRPSATSLAAGPPSPAAVTPAPPQTAIAGPPALPPTTVVPPAAAPVTGAVTAATTAATAILSSELTTALGSP
jgi:RNA polymerase sigma factor (sigma-70 family)